MVDEKEVSGKKSKIIFISLGIVLVIAIAIVLIIVLRRPVEPIEPITQSYDEVVGMIRLAVETNDRSVCQGIKHSGQRSDCEKYFLDFFLEKTETDCLDPINRDMKNTCEYLDAIKTNDVEKCYDIVDPLKDYCFMINAAKLNNLEICDDIENENAVQVCYGIAAKDKKYCDSIESETKQICSALALNDPEFCKQHSDPSLCLDVLKALNPFLGRMVFLEEI